MKKVIILAVAIMFMGTFPVFADYSEWSVRPHDHESAGKDSDDVEINLGGEIEGIVKFTDNLRLDVSTHKDVHQTNADEGWDHRGTIVWKKTFVDFNLFGN